MTGDEIREAARSLVERSCKKQGIPVLIDDAETLSRIARLIAASRGGEHDAA